MVEITCNCPYCDAEPGDQWYNPSKLSQDVTCNNCGKNWFWIASYEDAVAYDPPPKLTEDEKEGIKGWLMLSKWGRSCYCPFSELETKRAYERCFSICLHWFKRCRDSMKPESIPICPCKLYEMDEVEKIARAMIEHTVL